MRGMYHKPKSPVHRFKQVLMILTLALVMLSLTLFGCAGNSGETDSTDSQASEVDGTALRDDPTAYDGKTIEFSGQTFAVASPPKVVLDGRGAVNLSGNLADLGHGFYTLKGTYEASTNTLTVTESTATDPQYVSVQDGEGLGPDLVPVSLQGLIATVPKEVVDKLANYLPGCPDNLPVFPYAVFTRNGLYLVLSDHSDILPTEFTYTDDGTTYHLYFCAGEVKGTLVKTPLDSIDFGPNWTPSEFGGVVIADSLTASDPLTATVQQIVGSPGDFAFKRVSIDGSYLVATLAVDYSGFKLPFGVGLIADTSASFFKEGAPRLKTIDPEQKTWQLRDGKVIGTVLYPTEEVLTFLDYSAPLTKADVMAATTPILVIDTVVDDTVQVSSIADVAANPSQYWGKVVEFEGFGLGVNLSLKAVASAIAKTEIPVSVNLLAFACSDSYAPPPDLAIVGLNTDDLEGTAEKILGKYKFRVAVTKVPEELVSGLPIPFPDTAFFLLSKEELETTIAPPQFFSVTTSVTGSGTVVLSPPGGSYPSGLQVQLVALPANPIQYEFDHWSGDIPAGADSTSNILNITVDSSKNITANFRSKILASIAISPLNPSLAVTDTLQFTATGTYTDGRTVDLTTSAVWTSSHPRVVILPGGLATAALPTGTATITATVIRPEGTFQDSTTVTVTLF